MERTSRLGGKAEPVGRRDRSRFLLISVAAIVAVIAGTLSWQLVRATDTSTAGRESNAATGNLPPLPLGQPVISATIQLDPGVTDIVTGYGGVWASTATAIIRIDPLTNKAQATIPVEGIGDAGKLAAGEGAIWVTHDVSKVSRIDPATNQVVATMDVGPGVRGIATGGGRVWVTREPQPDEIDGYLVQIDPGTNTVVGKPTPVGVGPGPVVYGGGAVWVTLTSESGTLVKVDPDSMTVTARIDGVRGGAWYVAGKIWAPTAQSVLALDPVTGSVVDASPLPLSSEVAFGSGAVWVLTMSGATNSDIYIPDPSRPGTVVEVNPADGKPVGLPVPVGDSPSYMAAGEGAVWVAQYDSGTITRIDPRP